MIGRKVQGYILTLIATAFWSGNFIVVRGESQEIVPASLAFYSILYIGVFASMAAFLLWNKAIEKIGPARAGVIYYTLPLFGLLFAYFILDEKIKSYHIFSLIFIITGILLTIPERRHRNPDKLIS